MSKKKTHNEFMKELPQSRVEVVGRYTTKRTKIAVRCVECGRSWDAWPHCLIAGRGCSVCSSKDQGIKMRKENLILSDHGEWIEVDVSTKKHKTAVMFIDTLDYENIRSNCGGRIYAVKGVSGLYANVKYKNKAIRVHRLIVDGEVVDHKNHNTLDNRRFNLRGCARSQNSMNRSLDVRNKYGVTGVCAHKQTGKWVAQIMVNQKQHHLGLFSNFDDAVCARKKAEKKYFGEYSYDESTK